MALTPEQIEGPYWLPGSPLRRRLAGPDTVGEPLTISGGVRSALTDKPMAGAWIDVWQCDGNGRYDIDGDRLRGHQYTDEQGRFLIETVVPSDYVDHLEVGDQHFDIHRTAHIHVKVKGRMRPTLTTQLYLPDHSMNESDEIFNAACILKYSPGSTGEATFDFVLI